jgi:hypothetical protein
MKRVESDDDDFASLPSATKTHLSHITRRSIHDVSMRRLSAEPASPHQQNQWHSTPQETGAQQHTQDERLIAE